MKQKLYRRVQNDVSWCYLSYPVPRYSLMQKLDFPEVLKLTGSHTGLRQNTKMFKSTLFLNKNVAARKVAKRKYRPMRGVGKKGPGN